MLNHGTGRPLALCLAVAVVPVMPSHIDAAAHTTVVTSHTQALAEWRRINRHARDGDAGGGQHRPARFQQRPGRASQP